MDATSGDTTSEPEIRKKAAEKAQIQKPPTHFEDDSCVVFVKTSFARAFIPPPPLYCYIKCCPFPFLLHHRLLAAAKVMEECQTLIASIPPYKQHTQ